MVSGLPPLNSAIYVLWDKPQSDEPPGRYRAVVSEYHSDGEATIEYTNKATERVNLNAVEWKHTRNGQRPFLPLSKTPPLKEIRQDAKELEYYLSSHTVKGFADDLSVFFSNISEHQSLLSNLSTYSQNVDLTLRLDKCISVIFDGNKMDHKTTFFSQWLDS